MSTFRIRILTVALCAGMCRPAFIAPCAYALPPSQQTQRLPHRAVSRRIGAVKAINGTAITLTPDSGPDINVTVQPATHIVRIAPGRKNLKNATPIQLQDLQVGDRILAGRKDRRR